MTAPDLTVRLNITAAGIDVSLEVTTTVDRLHTVTAFIQALTHSYDALLAEVKS